MSELATLPKESAKAYQAFVDYVNLGPQRSLRKLVEQYNRPATYLRQLAVWSTEYDWQERLQQLAANQLESATELKNTTYINILGEYHRRVDNEPMRKSMQLNALHGIYDRVKPDVPQAAAGSGASITVNFAFVEVTKPE